MLINRREFIEIPVALAFTGMIKNAQAAERKKVAVIITEYRRNSHADVIVDRLLNGYYYNGERRIPGIQVVSMYTDQVPDNDMSRDQAAKHNVPIYKTITEALMIGTDRLAVEGVVFVGEHGKYPHNDKGQHMYPRYELYQQIVDVFRKTSKSVPVFCDKHLSYDWYKAIWMYEQSVKMGFPLMAGSSVPVFWRSPELELDLETPVERAVVPFYGGKDAYGFHALEGLQCMVERRKGGETGVAAVQCMEGPSVWKWTDVNPWAGRLLDESLKICSKVKSGSYRDNVKMPSLFIVEYKDGLKAALYELNGHISTWAFAADIRGKSKPVATVFNGQNGRPYGHFSSLVHYIEEMIVTGKPSYPVERTLLTTGTLAALLDSLYLNSLRMETPNLNIVYRAPEASLFARGPKPPADKDFGIGP